MCTIKQRDYSVIEFFSKPYVRNQRNIDVHSGCNREIYDQIYIIWKKKRRELDNSGTDQPALQFFPVNISLKSFCKSSSNACCFSSSVMSQLVTKTSKLAIISSFLALNFSS